MNLCKPERHVIQKSFVRKSHSFYHVYDAKACTVYHVYSEYGLAVE